MQTRPCRITPPTKMAVAAWRGVNCQHFISGILLKCNLCNFDLLITFCFGVSSNLSQQKSLTTEIIGIYFLGTIVPRKYMPIISTVGLLCCDKFEEIPNEKVVNMSKLTKPYTKEDKRFLIHQEYKNSTYMYRKLSYRGTCFYLIFEFWSVHLFKTYEIL